MFGLANNSNDIMLRDLEPFEQARRGSTASEPNSLSGSLSDLKIKSTPGDVIRLRSSSLNQEIQISLDLVSELVLDNQKTPGLDNIMHARKFPIAMLAALAASAIWRCCGGRLFLPMINGLLTFRVRINILIIKIEKSFSIFKQSRNTNAVRIDLTRLSLNESLLLAASKHTCGDEHLANCT
uniref:Uncharacterized protein n=1 Tax=Glossina pallidipes TaxID=7398 RepID=A0A1A9ZEL8_GLOPL